MPCSIKSFFNILKYHNCSILVIKSFCIVLYDPHNFCFMKWPPRKPNCVCVCEGGEEEGAKSVEFGNFCNLESIIDSAVIWSTHESKLIGRKSLA
jgi:hypothetical protein